MKMSVYSAVIKDIEKVKRFFNDELIEIELRRIKNDVRRCRAELNKASALYDELCTVYIKKPCVETKDITEILCKKEIDYSLMFLIRLIAECAAVHKAADGGGIKNLKKISEINFDNMFRLCREEGLLRNFEEFNISDEKTKMLYREKACKNAKKLKMTCFDYLKTLKGNDCSELFHKKSGGKITLYAEILAPIIFCLIFAAFYSFGASLLVFFPVWQITSILIVRISMHFFKTEELPRVNKNFPTEENCKTLIAVSTLLTSEKSLERMEKHIEQLYFSNCGENISLCISADLKSSARAESDSDKAILNAAEKAVRRINKVCGGSVTCVIRPRTYSDTQREFMGRERKRGALEDLILALVGEASPFSHIFGSKLPQNVKYILVLDSDTVLLPGCADRLIRTALHPRNASRYGIFSLRTESDFVNSTPFSRLLSGGNGVSSYHSACTERYQDIFGEGIFSGKGLINVERFKERCIGKFPPETVLSHDIVEGELTGTAYASSCRAIDSFPSSIVTYLKRLHRWVRGDWQNVGFIFSHDFSFLSKFKLFDNLRRSITPFFALLCIAVGAFASMRESAFLFISGLLSIIFGDLLSFGMRGFIRALIVFSQLPAEAAAGIDGAVRGIYRRFISKKNMLLWTTAHESETRSEFFDEAIFFLPNIIFGIILLFSPYIWAMLTGVAFTAYIPLSFFLGKRCDKTGKISSSARKKLLSDAEKMWGYYNDFATRENNFLPPDNVQLSPASRIAQRTSPTNIGLMLLSALASYDMKIITADSMCDFLENAVSAVEKLPKWYGNLYNWYDIKTLKIAESFVSSVDSGNFLCAAAALKNGLSEIGGERCESLAARIDKLLSDTDLRPLYNERRALLHIGYDAARKEKTENYYDLLMSEARLTSYYGVAVDKLPAEHWTALGRPIGKNGAYSGPLSWSGTSFEYFMPHIFLPAYRHTAEYRGLCFCFNCQKKYAKNKRIPFGISESGYYAFDDNMNYRYRANGIKSLSVKKQAETELVVSPYSSYLILPFGIGEAIKNLDNLRKLGAVGKYGLYEAIDFSADRIVYSFMAHHIGMSILSIDNALNGGIMQKRFLRGELLSAESLLHETI